MVVVEYHVHHHHGGCWDFHSPLVPGRPLPGFRDVGHRLPLPIVQPPRRGFANGLVHRLLLVPEDDWHCLLLLQQRLFLSPHLVVVVVVVVVLHSHHGLVVDAGVVALALVRGLLVHCYCSYPHRPLVLLVVVVLVRGEAVVVEAVALWPTRQDLVVVVRCCCCC